MTRIWQQMHTALMALTSYEPNEIVANSRKNPLEAWRRLQKRYDPTAGGRKRNRLRTIISSGRCSLLELQSGIERWECYVSRYEQKRKDKLDDEIKLAGLEALVPEELEKHLMLNLNRLRTFEVARLEIVTHVEAKFGLRIRDSKPGDWGRGDIQIPWMLMRSTLSRLAKEKGSSSPRDGCLKCGGAHFQRDCTARARKQSSGQTEQVMVQECEGKGKSKDSKGKFSGKSKGTKGANGKGETSKTGLSGLDNSKTETSSETQESAQTYPTDNSYTDTSWSSDGLTTGVRLDGTRVGNKRMTFPHAHFHL